MVRFLGDRVIKILTADHSEETDVVMPILQTSKTSAPIVAARLKKAYCQGFIENRYVFRTLYFLRQFFPNHASYDQTCLKSPLLPEHVSRLRTFPERVMLTPKYSHAKSKGPEGRRQEETQRNGRAICRKDRASRG